MSIASAIILITEMLNFIRVNGPHHSNFKTRLIFSLLLFAPWPYRFFLFWDRFSRGYLRHLILSREMLGPIMVSYHNLVYYQNFLRSLRDAIRADRLDEFRSVHLADVPASL